MTAVTKPSNEYCRLGVFRDEVLANLVKQGNWKYSFSKLNSDLEVYKTFTWIAVHPILDLLMAILCIAVGFITANVLALISIVGGLAREGHEVGNWRLKHDRSFESPSNSLSASSTTKNSNLHELLRVGAFTQEGFDVEQSKVLKQESQG